MNFIITVILSFGLILTALLVFRFIGLPIYRVEPINVKVLLETVLEGQATEADWDVFIGMTIRHNPDLDEIRLQCAMLAETEMSLRDDRVHFTPAGRGELSAILTRIKSELLPATEHHDD
ncbi:MAG: hypothetical protein P8P14_05805 [Porticoccaceae bacterium]|jgi:hypothetical protein|nr:hypothetical protein [Porticoccaceae bacterium]